MATCVLVSGLDATGRVSEMRSLFESAGTVIQAAIWFASPSAAQQAADLFNNHPHAGAFLEVKLTDGTAAARALAALTEVQTAAPGSGARAASTLRRAAAGQAKRHSPRLALIPAKQPAAAAGPGRPPTLRQKRSRDSEQRECLLCGSGTMRGKQWCRHPETKAEWLCHPCYGKERIRLTKRQREEQQRLDEQQRRQAAAQGLLRTCLECGTFKCGYQWSRHPVTKAEWLCSKCVGKAWRELQRQEKQEEKRQKQQAEQLAEESASPPPKRRKVADAAAAAGTQEREQHSQPDAGLQTLADAAAEALAQALGMQQAAAPQAVAARQEAAPQRPTRSSSQQHSTRRRAAPQGAALQRETRRSSTQHGTQRRAAPQGAALQRKTRRGSQQHSTQLGAAPQEAAAQRKTRRGSKLNPTVP